MPASARSCATSPAARPTARKRRRCGTSTSARPSPRPRWRTASGPGAYHKIPFARADGDGAIEIDTTRPELLAACVALVAHPDDERYQPLFGTKVTVPLYGQQVEVEAHELAQPDKGTGIAMICTFGDTTDVTWWRELDLPIARDHRARRSPPRRCPARRRPQMPTPRSPGCTSKQAQKAVVEQLIESRSADRRAPTDPTSGQVLRTRRTPARDRHVSAVVHPQRRA